MANVVFDNVFKRYGNVTVINDLNLEVREKEFMVLVGPSGSGKSTALRMIAGLEEISSGTVSIGGRVVNNVAPKDRDIAMVFQNYALYPHMNVFDNMAFALKLRRMPKEQIKDRVEAVADSLGIKHLLQRKPRQLSGGQRQRVALGRAAPAIADHDRICDARSGRGHDNGRPDRRAEGRYPAAGRYARQPVRQPGEYVCCRFHWLTRHEPGQRNG
jgi:ABC-type sugar transport system ATPase subunit